MLKAIRFDILRDVPATSRTSIPLDKEPIMVATLMNETAFAEDHFMVHNRTVFIEDRVHDWNWSDGRLRYYTRTKDLADVLVVYETADVEPVPKFDPMTGERLVNA